MTNEVYDVHTNLDPQQLTALAAETYRVWLNFALGKQEIGGHTLQHPTGQYAAALSWKRTGVASIAIIADESVPQVGWIEYGRAGADIKAAMLQGVTPGKDGYRSRVVPIRPAEPENKPSMSAADIVSASNKGGLPSGVAAVWATKRPDTDPASNWVTMSDNPNAHAKGVDSWKVPAMPAYAPAAVLADLLRSVAGK